MKDTMIFQHSKQFQHGSGSISQPFNVIASKDEDYSLLHITVPILGVPHGVVLVEWNQHVITLTIKECFVHLPWYSYWKQVGDAYVLKIPAKLLECRFDVSRGMVMGGHFCDLLTLHVPYAEKAKKKTKKYKVYFNQVNQTMFEIEAKNKEEAQELAEALWKEDYGATVRAIEEIK